MGYAYNPRSGSNALKYGARRTPYAATAACSAAAGDGSTYGDGPDEEELRNEQDVGSIRSLINTPSQASSILCS